MVMLHRHWRVNVHKLPLYTGLLRIARDQAAGWDQCIAARVSRLGGAVPEYVPLYWIGSGAGFILQWASAHRCWS